MSYERSRNSKIARFLSNYAFSDDFDHNIIEASMDIANTPSAAEIQRRKFKQEEFSRKLLFKNRK